MNDRAVVTGGEKGLSWREFWDLGRGGDGLATILRWQFAGLPPRDLEKHHRLELAKEDDWYIYLSGTAKTDRAKEMSKQLRIVLLKKEFRIRQLWVEQTIGNMKTIDYQGYEADPTMTPESLRVKVPVGWKRQDLTKPAGP